MVSTSPGDTPPNTNTSAIIGREETSISARKHTEENSLPATMRSAPVRVHSSKSSVCRSRSPEMAPLVRAGATSTISANCITER